MWRRQKVPFVTEAYKKPTTKEEKLQILGAEHTMAVLSCNPAVYLPIYLFLNHWLVRAKGQTLIFENLFKDYWHSSLFSSSLLRSLCQGFVCIVHELLLWINDKV